MLVSLDLETFLIRPGLQAPAPVCLSELYEGGEPQLWGTSDIEKRVEKALDQHHIVGHNLAYDMLCLIVWHPRLQWKIKAAYEEGRIIDTRDFERIAEIQGAPRKELSLDVCGQYYGLKPMDKDDSIRLTFGQYYGKALHEYSERHVAYCLADAAQPVELLRRQMKKHPRVNLADVALLSRSLLWLGATRAWGLRTDEDRVRGLEHFVDAWLSEKGQLVQDFGFVRSDGSKDTLQIKAAVVKSYTDGVDDQVDALLTSRTKKTKAKDVMSSLLDLAGPLVPRTSKDGIKTDYTTLAEADAPELNLFAEHGQYSAVKNKDLALLELGVRWPIHTKFGTANTLRSTSSNPNLQNIRTAAGVRECFKARDGFGLVSCDHGALEFVTFGQVAFDRLGIRNIVDLMNNDVDPHCRVSAHLMKCSYDDAVARKKQGEGNAHGSINDGYFTRQCGKVVNYGALGGAGAKRLQTYAKGNYGVVETVEFFDRLKKVWLGITPEAKPFFEMVNGLPRDGRGGYTVNIPGTTIQRSGATYCAACNTHFQGLGAVVEMEVGWRVFWGTRDPQSPLWGSHLANFGHDDFNIEAPLEGLHEAAMELKRLMEEVPRERLLRDIKISAEPAAMLHWSKSAKPVFEKGRLIPWLPSSEKDLSVVRNLLSF